MKGNLESPANNHVKQSTDVVRGTFVTGDRLCAACGYNLIGQAIVREPHYALLIARCPECGSVATAQEYPLLGRWAHRWGAVLAALWVLLIVSGWGASGAMLLGFGIAAAEQGARPYSRFVQSVFAEVEKQSRGSSEPGVAPNVGAGAPPPTQTIIIQRSGISQRVTTLGGVGSGADFAKWWDSQDHALLLEQAGGWRIGIQAELLVMWFFFALMMIVLGWFWATLLVQLRRRGLLAWGGSVLLLATLLALVPMGEWLAADHQWSWNAGQGQVAPVYLGVSFAISIIGLGIGLATGRPVARLMVRLLLPPRMRHALAILWTCDGRELPPVT